MRSRVIVDTQEDRKKSYPSIVATECSGFVVQ